MRKFLTHPVLFGIKPEIERTVKGVLVDDKNKVFAFVYSLQQRDVEVTSLQSIDIKTYSVTVSCKQIIKMLGGIISAFAPIADEYIISVHIADK